MTHDDRDHSTGGLSIFQMMVAGIRHAWRIAASVALGVATATAVIVGALLVGDSMRGSLRELTIERLGRTESILAPGSFFQSEGITDDGISTAALIYFPAGSIESRDSQGEVRRAGDVQVIACDPNFWDLDATGIRPQQMPGDNSVVLNESAASDLGVAVGDQITVRLPSEQAVPADSPLGSREIQSEGLPRMTVVDIVADRGLGRFAISPSQASPKNVYLSREVVAETLDRDGQANVLLFDSPVTIDDLSIDLEDLGLSLRTITRSVADAVDSANSERPKIVYRYESLTSDRLLVSETVVDRVADALPAGSVVPVMTYLANAIERLDENGQVVASVPYSLISGIDSSDGLPLDYTRPEGVSQRELIPLVINDWTAEQLGASKGTRVRVAYFEPEVENGKEIEKSFEALVTMVVPITEPAKPYTRNREAVFDQPPTVYNDPDLTPTVPGLTDKNSISDWDLPFPQERTTSLADDRYVNQYRLTPKAFLPIAEAREMFGSRFGQTTGLRISDDAAADHEALRGQILACLQPVLDELGWQVRPIRQQQLASSRGTTPFDGLFLALSFFVILSAVLLIAMLFRLGLVARMKQFGTLMAVGWTPGRVRSVMMGEGLIVATAGVVIGIGGGVLYAMGVLWALRSWWVGAVTVPFLTFHWTPRSLLIGGAIGWVVAASTLLVTIRWILKFDAQELLSGKDLDAAVGRHSKRSRLPMAGGLLVIIAIGLAVWGAVGGGQAAVGGFVGGGMMLLIAGLTLIYHRLRQPRRINEDVSGADYGMVQMVTRNASRHPMRSTMTIGLMATAAFLIIAITAFRLQPTDAGTGGFQLIAESAQPLYRDLGDPSIQSELLGPDAGSMIDATVAAMRLRPGQDASCNNLYQATQPTILGVPDSFAELFRTSAEKNTDPLVGFDWIASVETTEGKSSWDSLQAPAAGTEPDPIPVVIDQNTAMWSLQMTGGIGEVRSFQYGSGPPTFFRGVGLLSNSMLQGRLMIGEANFERLFPSISGYRLFLIHAPESSRSSITTTLENRLGDVGMDVAQADTVLAGMLAVQNTYLRTFQSLGALGLLLGTVGLAVSQLRSVLERRLELAVMRAIGFSGRRLATVVMGETAFLLLAGIGCGAVCAIIAVVPYSWVTGMRPPIAEPLVVVAGIVVFGLLAGLVAVRRVGRMPLLESLRSET